jgi:ABC-type amino acid transport substrate-binding protein
MKLIERKQYRRQMAFYVLLLAVVIACMVALSYCDKPVGAVAATHSGGDTLDIAIEYSPMTYYTYDDTLGGFNYDMLRLVSREAGRPMKFHPIVTLEKGLEGLDTGLYDVLVAQFPITASSRAHYLFTDSIYIDRQVLVQRADARRVKSQLQLAHDTVHVVRGSSMEERIASLGREIGDTIYVITEDTYGPEQLAMLVSTGEIKMAVINEFIARHMAEKLGNIDCSVSISLSQFQSWTLRHDNVALRDSLNAWVGRVKQHSAEYSALRQRYFKH